MVSLNMEGNVELSIAEQLLYSTVRLTSRKDGQAVAYGTGFFFRFLLPKGEVSAIITNKHVVDGASEIRAVCHLMSGEEPTGKFINCDITLAAFSLVNHPSPEVDLCAIIFSEIENRAREAGTPIFLKSLTKDLIPREADWQFFDAIEDVTMIGCPRGIYDAANNFPIVRRGITASALSVKYEGRNEFMVDMACFHGSSGSPIFLYDRNGYLDRKERTYRMGATRVQLVGILYGGPTVQNDGRIILAHGPRVEVNATMHLGNAIRATEILVLEQEIERLLDQHL
ncbi:S1 family peptidase [Sinorhizobium meliloti]|uniref:S1 family peptidase n=1 Tax=Rhizobium meliloti TaxID=382 RepID=UPI003F180A3E